MNANGVVDLRRFAIVAHGFERQRGRLPNCIGIDDLVQLASVAALADVEDMQ